MKKMKFNNIIKNTILILSAFVLLLLFTFSIIYKSSVINEFENVLNQYVSLQEILSITIITIFLIFFFTFLSKSNIKIKKKYLIVFLLILYLFISIKWINYSNITPTDDSMLVNNSAISIINHGLKSLYHNEYIAKSPHQMGMILAFTIIYKLFSTTNYQLIQYCNIIANIFTIYGLYLILQEFKIKVKKISLSFIYFTLILTFIPLILLSSYVYGDYIGLSLAVYAIYFIIKYKKNSNYRFLFFSGFLLSLAYIIKTNYLIFIIAAGIYILLIMFKKQKKYLVNSFILFSYLSIALLPNTLIKSIGTKALDIKSTQALPTSSYIYMGMSESIREAGWYGNTMDYAWINPIGADQKYKSLIKQRFNYFINHPLYTLNFYSRKTVSGWINPFFQSIWYNVNNANKGAELNKIFNSKIYYYTNIYLKSLLLLIYGGALINLIFMRKKMSYDIMLLYLIFLGGFMFHTLWEMKARYTLPYVIILIPLASIGIAQLSEQIYKKSRVIISKKQK